jgi:hypothetical protein
MFARHWRTATALTRVDKARYLVLWLCLSAGDYTLYVNGAAVGRNHYLLEAGNALQSRLSARTQV